MRAVAFADGDADRWDALVAASPMGTFLHSRRFLSYHGARFEDRSVLLLDGDDQLVGVLPAAVDADDGAAVVSHPGATYGGLVFDDRQTREELAGELLAAACAFLRDAGHTRLIYKAVPPHLHSWLCQQDLHAIWRCGGKLVRRELWNIVDLRDTSSAHDGRLRSIRRAKRKGVTVARDDSDEAYATVAAMLRHRLAERHGLEPVHTLEEMRELRDLLAPQVQLWLARDEGGACVAGVWLFEHAPAARHAQYGTTNAAGREVRAQEVLLDAIIEAARADGVRCFSFGASTDDGGATLNGGLFAYKAAFGAGSVAQDFYEIDLTAAANG